MDLLDLIVCTRCNTRVEYHDGPDGYMSCECWIMAHREDPRPIHWHEIEDRKVNLCGGCSKDINERSVFRCADCGRPFHQVCLDHHCNHGNQKQELRSDNLLLKERLQAALSTAKEAVVALEKSREVPKDPSCPSCAALRVEVERLREAVEFIRNRPEIHAFGWLASLVQEMVFITDGTHRRAKEGK